MKIQRIAYSIFGIVSGEYCPFEFSEIFPLGLTRGRALIYLDYSTTKNRLAKIFEKNRLNPNYGSKLVSDDLLWVEDFYSIRGVRITDEEYSLLLTKDIKGFPEEYKFIFIGGWEIPKKSKRLTFHI